MTHYDCDVVNLDAQFFCGCHNGADGLFQVRDADLCTQDAEVPPHTFIGFFGGRYMSKDGRPVNLPLVRSRLLTGEHYTVAWRRKMTKFNANNVQFTNDDLLRNVRIFPTVFNDYIELLAAFTVRTVAPRTRLLRGGSVEARTPLCRAPPPRPGRPLAFQGGGLLPQVEDRLRVLTRVKDAGSMGKGLFTRGVHRKRRIIALYAGFVYSTQQHLIVRRPYAMSLSPSLFIDAGDPAEPTGIHSAVCNKRAWNGQFANEACQTSGVNAGLVALDNAFIPGLFVAAIETTAVIPRNTQVLVDYGSGYARTYESSLY